MEKEEQEEQEEEEGENMQNYFGYKIQKRLNSKRITNIRGDICRNFKRGGWKRDYI